MPLHAYLIYAFLPVFEILAREDLNSGDVWGRFSVGR